MTRTTRPERTKTDARRPARCAPRCVVLKADAYAELSPQEKRRYDTARDLEAIFDAYAQAQLDAEAVGFPASYRSTDSSRSTGEVDAALFAASQHPSPAVDWLAEAAEAIAHVRVAGDKARRNWPLPFAPGSVITQDGQSITVGGRGNSVDVCAWCHEVARSGHDEVTRKTLIRKVDDFTVHTRPCYQQVYREAARRAITMPALLAEHAAEQKKAC